MVEHPRQQQLELVAGRGNPERGLRRNPALAVFRDSSGVEKLYCVHKGSGSDRSLW
ncbi:hypothetical protein OH799_02680 [Nocardia sp. NBC_00881]|uniref:hypothetical protein n=1 Tax=Nocardia sp. NBC_00881 TaxID=2975995 RepID=UPI00386FE317|nr:hypothetical protein OH799_02680 [Nocardia sp. NBC_00881]